MFNVFVRGIWRNVPTWSRTLLDYRQGLSLFKKKKWQCNIYHFPLLIIQKKVKDLCRWSAQDDMQLAFRKRLRTQPHIQNTQREWDLQITIVWSVWCFFSSPLSCAALLKRHVWVTSSLTGNWEVHRGKCVSQWCSLRYNAVCNPALLKQPFGSHPL